MAARGDRRKLQGCLPAFLRRVRITHGFEADHYRGGMHLYAASPERPENFEPTFPVNYQSKRPWLNMNDDLPRYEGTLLHAPASPEY